MNQIGSFEDVIEKGQGSVKQAAKSTQQGVSSFVKTAAGQTSNSTPSDQGTNEAGNQQQQKMSDDDAQKFLQDLYGVKTPVQNSNSQVSQNSASQGVTSQGKKPQQNQQTVKAALGLELSKKPHEKAPTPKETIKTALGISEAKPAQDAPTVKETIKAAMGIPEVMGSQKTPEEVVKMQALRNQLHSEYYQKLIKPQQQAEENVVDKLEREEQEEKLADLETNKQKPPPLPATVKQGTGENVVGVSG